MCRLLNASLGLLGTDTTLPKNVADLKGASVEPPITSQ